MGRIENIGISHPYLLEWDSVSYPPKFRPPTLHMYDGKNFPNQYIYYFRSQTDNVIDNDAIITRLFINTLKGIAFDWFRSLSSGSINSWVNLKTQFLSRFNEDDIKVTMDKLLSNNPEGRRVRKGHIERFCNLSLM